MTDKHTPKTWNQVVDEILYQYRDDYDRWQADPRGSGTNGIKLQAKAKSALNNAVKEIVIRQDEYHIDKSFGTERKVITKPIEYRNEHRAEQRKIVDGGEL